MIDLISALILVDMVFIFITLAALLYAITFNNEDLAREAEIVLFYCSLSIILLLCSLVGVSNEN